MDMKKLKTEEAPHCMGQFNCLPEDLILLILSMMDLDLKNLCQLFLVSKKFASIVNCIGTVRFSLPSPATLPFKSKEEIRNIVCKIRNCTREGIPHLIDSSPIQRLKICKSFYNFKDLKFIYMEVDCPKLADILSVFTVKVKDSNPEKSIGIQNERPIKVDGEGAKCSPPTLMLSYTMEWLSVLLLVIKCHDSLQRVTITDSKKRGVIELKEEHFVRVK